MQTAQTFVDKANALDKQVNALWVRKEWGAAIAPSQALLHDYDSLPADMKKASRYFASNTAYNLACAFSLTGKPEDAIVVLRRAIKEFGYLDYAHMKQDTDLNSLHSRSDFKALLGKLRKVSDYPTILKAAPNYSTQQDKNAPQVSYENKDVESLRSLRERYHLDEVAGTGDEVSRLKNLMLWVNHQVEHDGSSFPPSQRNAPALLDVAKAEKHGLNCRMMSTILNDVLLSEGFATRHITCMPKNPDDNDCHVINVVYCKTMAKWVWMDASFAGYWTDERGTLLSIAEVRERIRAGETVNAALTLHHNNDPYTQSEYLDYMTKNLYWFKTPVESRFDYETGGTAHYLALVPPGEKQGWMGSTYYTSDPVAFWKQP